VEAIVAAIEERVRNVHPEVVLLLIKPQSAAAFERARVRPLEPIPQRDQRWIFFGTHSTS